MPSGPTGAPVLRRPASGGGPSWTRRRANRAPGGLGQPAGSARGQRGRLGRPGAWQPSPAAVCRGRRGARGRGGRHASSGWDGAERTRRGAPAGRARRPASTARARPEARRSAGSRAARRRARSRAPHHRGREGSVPGARRAPDRAARRANALVRSSSTVTRERSSGSPRNACAASSGVRRRWLTRSPGTRSSRKPPGPPPRGGAALFEILDAQARHVPVAKLQPVPAPVQRVALGRRSSTSTGRPRESGSTAAGRCARRRAGGGSPPPGRVARPGAGTRS